VQCQGQDQPKLSVALDELGQHDGAGAQTDLYHTTDSANAGTEIAGEFPTTRGNFRPAHILFDDYSRGRER